MLRGTSGAPARDIAQRRSDALAGLAGAERVWVGTTGPDGPHLVPLSCEWDGARLVMATHEGNLTVRNLRHTSRTRLTPGSTTDVLILDGTTEIHRRGAVPPDVAEVAARLPMRPVRPDVVVLVFTPARILTWRHRDEIAGRTVMRNGRWLG